MTEWLILLTVIAGPGDPGGAKAGDVLGSRVAGAAASIEACRAQGTALRRGLSEELGTGTMILSACVPAPVGFVDAVAEAQGWEANL